MDLAELPTHRLTVVQACAGFGKTRLLRRWRDKAAGTGVEVDWLQWKGMGAALWASATETVGERMKGRTTPLLIFIDDAERVCQADVGPLLPSLLDGSEHLRLVVAGRLGGFTGLSRLRATGEAVVVGADALRLTDAQAQSFVGATDDPEIAAWITAAEGWPILLRFLKAGLAAGDQPNRLHTVGATAADLLDAFVEDEILQPLAPDLRAFLLRTSVVAEIDTRLGHILHGDASEDIVERLIRRHGLLTLEPRSGKFRVNPLIRLSLLRRQRSASGPTIIEQQRVVHNHLMAEEAFDQAVLHACDIGDFPTCVALFRRFSPTMLALRCGLKTVREVLARVPAEHFRDDAGLRMSRALILSKEGRMRDARRLLDEARASLGRQAVEDEGCGSGVEAILLDITLALQAEEPVSIELAETLETLAGQLPPTDHLRQGWLQNILCRLLYTHGQLEGAAAAGMLATRYYQAAGAPYGEFFMHLHLGSIRLWQGHPAQAVGAFERAQRLAARHLAGDAALAATARLLRAEALFDLNGAVEEDVTRELRLSEENDGWLDVFVSGYRVEALRLFQHDAPEAALDVLRRAGETAARNGDARLRSILRALQVELLTFAGRRTAAMALLRQSRRQAANDLGAPVALGWRERLLLNLAEARLMLHLRQYKRSGLVLEAAEAESAAMGAGRPLLKARILQALLHAARGARHQAVTLLVEMLAGVEEDFPIRTFLDEGEPMARLCALALRMKGSLLANEDVSARLQAIQSILEQAPTRKLAEDCAEPLLTARERDVLLNLSKGCSNKITAERLNVTEATVKFHLRRIYRKLGATNRVSALSIAQQQDMLS